MRQIVIEESKGSQSGCSVHLFGSHALSNGQRLGRTGVARAFLFSAQSLSDKLHVNATLESNKLTRAGLTLPLNNEGTIARSVSDQCRMGPHVFIQSIVQHHLSSWVSSARWEPFGRMK